MNHRFTELPMESSVLLGCYEVPGYGGASTAAYELFHAMRRDGMDVSFVNIVDEQDAGYFRYSFGEHFGNPEHLSGVHNCILRGRLYLSHPELSALIQTMGPSTLIGVGFIAALLMKQAAPERKLVFLTSGAAALKDAIERKEVKDFLTQERVIQTSRRGPVVPRSEEKQAVDLADLIVVHSDAVMLLYKYYYPQQAGKIHSRVVWGEWIYSEALEFSAFRVPFAQRDIDVLFAANSWNRPEKNYALVKKVARRLRGASIHIAGDTGGRSPYATHHGLVADRTEFFKLIGRAKTVVCPSLFDAAPGILFEASAMGCNIVASKNCGNWMICNDQLLVDGIDPAQFLEKITLSSHAKYQDNMDYFLQTGSYQHLLEVISVF
jgi:glycosyltransferase involved in cell wall biosynthesis